MEEQKSAEQKPENKNKMKEIKIEKTILHCSTAEPARLERCMKLLKFISGKTPIKTLARKRIPTFKIRPGLPIGCKVTLRKGAASEVLKKILDGGISSLKEDSFNNGFLSFGVKEYIELSTLPYQRDIGILGFEVVVTLTRTGRRISKRKIKRSKQGIKQKISKEETIEFFKNKFNLNIEE